MVTHRMKNQSLELHNILQRTSTHEWDIQDIVCELTIQLGHLIQATGHTVEAYAEEERNLKDIGDEIADVHLQLSLLMLIFNLEPRLKSQEEGTIHHGSLLTSAFFIASQLMESSMRLNGKRFSQKRDDLVNNEEEFFKLKLSQLYTCITSLTRQKQVILNDAFADMSDSIHKFAAYYKDYRKSEGGLFSETQTIGKKLDHKLKQLHQMKG